MQAVTYSQTGGPEVLSLTNLALPTPAADELLIKVHATGQNRADLSQRKGNYPAPTGHSPLLGLEAAGEITGWGNNVSGFSKGQRVFGLVNGGAYAQYCVIDKQMAMPIPEHWSYPEAAAIPEAFFTADEVLFRLGNLMPKETVLIHAAGSGVGTAAVQLAQAVDANVFFTAGSAEKIQRILALGAHTGFNYKTQDFATEIEKITQGTGVNLILDFIGAAYLEKNINSLTTNGRLIIISLMGGAKTEISLSNILLKRLQIKGMTLRSQSLAEKRAITQRFMRQWLPLFSQGKLKPIIDHVFPMTEVQQAHQYMEANKNFGKIILSWDY